MNSCELDPLPPFVMVNILDDLAPFLVYVFNRSLTEGYLPASQKRAIVFPTLKKQNLDQNACQNYRPISNLSFLSKTLERLVSLQLLPYFEQAGLLPAAQSGFRGHHSTETTLLSLLSDIYVAIDQSHLSLLALFDVSSAFDMVDHEILLQRLELSCGLSGIPLLWFKSYLTDRTQMVVLGDSRTEWVGVKFGVPQGSVFGPILYILFTADISLLFSKHRANGHLYADDTQAFVHGPSSDQLSLVRSIDCLASDLHYWMSTNRLCLNATKTQLIWFGTIYNSFPNLTFNCCRLKNSLPTHTLLVSVTCMGVTLDSALTFTEHISNLTRSCFFQLRRLRAIRRSVSSSVFTTIVHVFICSRLDYCNSLLMGLPKQRLSPLQSVLNASARLIARLPRFSHISTYMLDVLHWLPITARIHYKILFLVSKAQLSSSQKYLSDYMRKPLSATSSRSLRFALAPSAQLHMPKSRPGLGRSFCS